MKKVLLVLLSVLLIVMSFEGTWAEEESFAWDGNGAILSEAVDLAVPEEEVALEGAAETAGYADFVGETAASAVLEDVAINKTRQSGRPSRA